MTATVFGWRATAAAGRSVRLDRWGRDSWCNALGVDLPRPAARRGCKGPALSWARRHQAEGDLAEQGRLGTAGRQVHADARDVLDDTRTDLDEPVTDGRELGLGQRVGLGDRGAHGVHEPEGGGMQDEAYL